MTWLSSLSDIALAYDLPEEDIEQRMYALAEYLHQYYCLQRGIINHNEARPDQSIALAMLGAMASGDWYLVRDEERDKPPGPDEFRLRKVGKGPIEVQTPVGEIRVGESVVVSPDEVIVDPEAVFVHFGDDTVNEGWAKPDDTEES